MNNIGRKRSKDIEKGKRRKTAKRNKKAVVLNGVEIEKYRKRKRGYGYFFGMDIKGIEKYKSSS